MLLIFFLIYFITIIIITTYSVARIIRRTFNPLFQYDEVHAVIPISKTRKLRYRDVKRLSKRLKLNNLMKFVQIVRERRLK